ncbi:MAG: hypothetical protein ICV85_14955 [Tolypothrix sp. T3-bin4]|nr:hypothetical protein [Tolypothrix sp. T3-bin4]
MSSQYLFLALTRIRYALEVIKNFFYREEYLVVNTNNLYPLNQAISQLNYIFCLEIANIWGFLRIWGINAIASGISKLSFSYSSVAKVLHSSSILLKPLAGKELLQIIRNLLKELE